MSEEIDPKIHDAVSRFFKSRREGVRLSVEAALGGRTSAADAVSAARLIAQSAKSRGAPSMIGGTPGDGASADHGRAEPVELPEIEGYDIIDIVGRGGMGAVYEAYQRSTGRRVAVKMMLETLGAGERTRRRFEREVELVARLQHPNIVSVLDSGVQRGRYFYVMEFIEGRTLDAAYPPGAASPRAVLEILARIALAVDYAHQRGVIHRDLKPGNILIDGRGEPHLLDFGLAKSFDPNSLVGVRASLSEPGQFLGTLLYMPPEQARGETEHMSVRSDVYSLGAIGYELITGRPPCGTDGPLGLVLERINSIDPARPSTIRAEVERDCDAILMKCLEKAPTRRYGSAGELAADIRRSLDNEPSGARRTGVPVRAWRWVKRHKLATTVAVAVIAVGVTSGGLWTLHIIRTAEYNERAMVLQTQRIKDSAKGGAGNYPPEISLADLARQSADTRIRFGSMPDKRAEQHLNIGAECRRWGSPGYAIAHEELTLARDLYRQSLGPDALETVEAEFELGGVLYFMGQYEEARAMFEHVLAVRQKRLGRGDTLTIRAIVRLAACVQLLGRYAEAESLHREAVAALRPLSTGADAGQLASPLNNLGSLLNETGRFAEAEQLLREALPLAAQWKTDPGVQVARTRTNLAIALMRQGRAQEALTMLDEALDAKRGEYKLDTDDIASTLAHKAEALMILGRRDEAMTACSDALEMQRRALGPDHPNTAPFMIRKARFLLDFGNPAEAEPLAATALESRKKGFGPDHPHIAEAEAVLADCWLRSGRAADAEPMLRRAVAILLQTRGELHPVTQRALNVLIQLLIESGRPQEAEQFRQRLGLS